MGANVSRLPLPTENFRWPNRRKQMELKNTADVLVRILEAIARAVGPASQATGGDL